MGDDYCSWQDLLNEDESIEKHDRLTEKNTKVEHDLKADNIPPELQHLFDEKEKLEQKLKNPGATLSEVDNDRFKKLYPVKVHTKATRIEDKRLKRFEEKANNLKQHRLALQTLKQKTERHQQELYQDFKKRQQLEQGLRKRWVLQKQVALLKHLMTEKREALWDQERNRQRRETNAQRLIKAKQHQQILELQFQHKHKQRKKLLMEKHWQQQRQYALQEQQRQIAIDVMVAARWLHAEQEQKRKKIINKLLETRRELQHKEADKTKHYKNLINNRLNEHYQWQQNEAKAECKRKLLEYQALDACKSENKQNDRKIADQDAKKKQRFADKRRQQKALEIRLERR